MLGREVLITWLATSFQCVTVHAVNRTVEADLPSSRLPPLSSFAPSVRLLAARPLPPQNNVIGWLIAVICVSIFAIWLVLVFGLWFIKRVRVPIVLLQRPVYYPARQPNLTIRQTQAVHVHPRGRELPHHVQMTHTRSVPVGTGASRSLGFAGSGGMSRQQFFNVYRK